VLMDRDLDDIRDSLAVAAAMLARPELAIGGAPEEAWWMLAHPSLRPLLATPHAGGNGEVGSGGLADTGYYVSRSRGGDHLVIDGGPHGYRNGGHAHADALSLTLTVRHRRLLVDTGTGSYTVDPQWRDRLRSTGFHNTLVIDGRSQSLPRGPFHWHQTADARVCRWRTSEGFDYFEGTHNGYQPIEHRRHVFVVPGDLVVVADLVRGDGTHTAVAHWHIDPQWTSAFADGTRQHLNMTAGTDACQLLVSRDGVELFHGDADSGLGWHSPVYGRIEALTTVRVTHTGSAPFWMLTVFGLAPDNPVERLDVVPVWAEAGALEASIALKVERQQSTEHVLVAHPAGESSRATWRMGDFETDAHLLFCRTTGNGRVARVALVDGAAVHAPSRGLDIVLPRRADAFHVDFTTPVVSDRIAQE
jgi:hypothetical protein